MLYVNHRTLDIFGCETLEQFKELTGYTFRGLVHPDDFVTRQEIGEKRRIKEIGLHWDVNHDGLQMYF